LGGQDGLQRRPVPVSRYTADPAGGGAWRVHAGVITTPDGLDEQLLIPAVTDHQWQLTA
jgi:hypothetical protein